MQLTGTTYISKSPALVDVDHEIVDLSEVFTSTALCLPVRPKLIVLFAEANVCNCQSLFIAEVLKSLALLIAHPISMPSGGLVMFSRYVVILAPVSFTYNNVKVATNDTQSLFLISIA